MPETGGSDLYLTDLSPGDKPWDTHRALAETVQAYYSQSDFQRYAERISQCSRLLGFALEQQDRGDLKPKLRDAQFCRVRHCPVCQWRRSLMWRARFFKALPKIIEKYPTYRYIFLTLTVKNCPLSELRETLRHMNKSWQRLSELKRFPAFGWVRSVEVTRGQDGLAHPHFHCLLMVPSSFFTHGYIKQADWTELWKKSLRADYTPIVNVKAVKPKKSVKVEDSKEFLESALVAGILETLKYSVKPDDLAFSPEWLAELTNQLHKTRAISVGGIFRDFISDEEPEDLIHGEDEEISLTEEDTRVWFGWREMVRRYAKTERC